MKQTTKVAVFAVLMAVGITGGVLITGHNARANAKKEAFPIVEGLVKKEWPGAVLIEYAVQTKGEDGVLGSPTYCGWIHDSSTYPTVKRSFIFKNGSPYPQKPADYAALSECVAFSKDGSVKALMAEETQKLITDTEQAVQKAGDAYQRATTYQ